MLRELFQPRASMVTNTMTTGTLEQIFRSLISTTASGIAITPETALRCSAVFACIKVISETIAQLPIHLYRRLPNGGKELATDHPLYSLIGVQPNHLQTSFGFREMQTAHAALRGNSYALKNRVGMGRVAELIPLSPDDVVVKLDSMMQRTYTIRLQNGQTRDYSQDDVFHLMGMTLNGWQGVSVLTYARESVGLSLATEKFGAKLFSNGAKMSGILTYPGKFKLADTAQKIGQDFDTSTSGGNAHKTIVLDDGMKWEKVSMTNEDSQFLGTRGYQVPEIARFFRMPLHKIQDMSASTNNNIEQQALEFLTDCMMPWFVRSEQTYNTQLLSDKEQPVYFFKHDVDELLRADMVSRFTAYSQAISARIFSPNECREKEDMNPYEGGDTYENPAITPGQHLDKALSTKK